MIDLFIHRPANGRPARISLGAIGSAPLFVAVLLTCSCSPKAPAPDPDILARVGEVLIRTADLQQELDRRIQAGRPILSKNAVLEEMVSEEVLVQRARAAGLEQDPELLRAYRSLLVGLLRQQELMPQLENVTVSPEEVEAQYQKERARYTRPAQIRLAMLHLETAPHLSQERRQALRARLEEAREKAGQLPQGTRGFGALAIDYSEDQVSRYRGGDVGWVSLGAEKYRWPARVVSAAQALPALGAVSDVMETESGFFLVMKMDSREPVTTPLAQVEEGIRRRVLAEKRRHLEEDFMQVTRAACRVEVHPEGLADIPLPVSALARTEPLQPPAFP